MHALIINDNKETEAEEFWSNYEAHKNFLEGNNLTVKLCLSKRQRRTVFLINLYVFYFRFYWVNC